MEAAKPSPPVSRWLYRPWVDVPFILAPAFVVTALVLLFPRQFAAAGEMAPQAWLLLIVGVDVAHVYSTLWRTYLDPAEFARHRALLTYAPLGVWVGGIVLYTLDPAWFWRVLAYLAVYHFVRQQYGFMRLYARADASHAWERTVDAVMVYALTLYPVLYWHCHLPRRFDWFVAGDFLALPDWGLDRAGFVAYLLIIGLYVVKEVRMALRQRSWNWPKNLVLLGTGLSWYCGIVLYDGDLAFTATNVVAHGLPYMAIVWIYGRRKQDAAPAPAPNWWMRLGFRAAFLPVFVGLLLALAYLEEGLWDGLVWRDHEGLFPWAATLPLVEDRAALALLVPLLSLPQVTHYVVDGFIWRRPAER